MKVLIIPEDPTYDRHILQPIVEHLFADLGRAARVTVLEDPHLNGVEQSLDAERVSAIVEDYQGMVDLFLLMVDRDCDRMGNVGKAAAREAEHAGVLLGCLAVEEVEVWMLALHRELLDAGWLEVRTECDPKERFAEPFLNSQGWTHEVGHGRKRAMRALAQQ